MYKLLVLLSSLGALGRGLYLYLYVKVHIMCFQADISDNSVNSVYLHYI